MRLFCEFSGEVIQFTEDAELGAGGEARVFALPQDASRVVKVYHHPTQMHMHKLKAMVANPPVDPRSLDGNVSIAWPRDLLYTMPARQFVGYLMPRVSGTVPICDVYNPSARQESFPDFTYLHLIKIARMLAETVAAIHEVGYVIGDVSESNILVNELAMITVVDTDSFQVRDPHSQAIYRCPVGKPEFTPPELLGQHFSQVDRKIEHDLFGLAMLIFHLLMEGWHPYLGSYATQDDPPTLAERIAAGHFPYARRTPSPCQPPSLAPPFDILAPNLQGLFLRCFEDGYTNPGIRPTAADWYQALYLAEISLVSCELYPQHWYGQHLTECPWCERSRQYYGNDAFPTQEKLLTVIGAEPLRGDLDSAEDEDNTATQITQWVSSFAARLRKEKR